MYSIGLRQLLLDPLGQRDRAGRHRLIGQLVRAVRLARPRSRCAGTAPSAPSASSSCSTTTSSGTTYPSPPSTRHRLRLLARCSRRASSTFLPPAHRRTGDRSHPHRHRRPTHASGKLTTTRSDSPGCEQLRLRESGQHLHRFAQLALRRFDIDLHDFLARVAIADIGHRHADLQPMLAVLLHRCRFFRIDGEFRIREIQ